MQKAGKILVKNLKTLITGSSTRLGNALTKHLVQKGSSVYSVDQNILTKQRYGENHHFQQGNLADESFLKSYLKEIGPIDALVNCAGFRSSYNYFLSYLISKQILEKFQENSINEFGCRGCIVNLVFPEAKYTQEYFKEQDDFIEKYKINTEKIDEDVYQLANLLTAARVRCNTLIVDSKLHENTFVSMVTHILEDQYVAGQVINLEDNLKYQEKTTEEFLKDIETKPRKKHIGDLKYVSPPEIQDSEPSSKPILPLPSK